MNVKLVAVGPRLLVQPIEQETQRGSIILVASEEAPQLVTVVSVGDQVKYEYFRVGDTLAIAKYAGVPIEHGGEKVIAVNETDVLARVTR
jgi:co-chaperonin GroES (HSP10)